MASPSPPQAFALAPSSPLPTPQTFTLAVPLVVVIHN
jgi:hypothetical protein